MKEERRIKKQRKVNLNVQIHKYPKQEVKIIRAVERILVAWN